MSFHEISIAIHQFPPLICNIFSADSTNLLARSNLSLLLTGVRRTWVSYAYVLDCWACWYTTPPSFPLLHKFSLNSPSFWSPPSRPGSGSVPFPPPLSWAELTRAEGDSALTVSTVCRVVVYFSLNQPQAKTAIHQWLNAVNLKQGRLEGSILFLLKQIGSLCPREEALYT